MKRISFVVFLITLQLLGGASIAFASDDPVSVQVLRGRDSGIVKDSVLENWDPNFYNLAKRARILHTDQIVNVISLKIDDESPVFIPDSFNINVAVEITLTDQQGHDSIITDSLKIHYRPGEGILSGSENYSVYYGACKVKVKIVNITSDQASWDVTQVLILESTIQASRQYLFDCDAPIAGLQDNLSGIISDSEVDELKVTWSDPNSGQTDYDLEWAWVDENAQGNFKDEAGNWEPFLVFPNNSTRITIPANINSYKIPLFYDGRGYLLYRVRPVQRNGNSGRFEGLWTSSFIPGHGTFFFEGHENNLNWQTSTSYAEDGKRKTVVQYFDGSLRGRQTVTKDNSIKSTSGEEEPTTVVAETFYDYQGRPTIQVLPSPTLNTVISYAHNFNRNIANNTGYPKDMYDEITGTGGCDNGATQLSDDLANGNMGAALYYSQNNLWAQGNFHKYIPDANGYPFTETRYTQDATGRVAAQSGVGQTHKIGSGHETKYYYTTPMPEELDALFGTDVGLASHYSKNAVKDANGQFSISYVDMYGRTIATALAGIGPDNLKKLASNFVDPSNPLTRTTSTLLDEVNNIVKGNTIEMVKELVVTDPGTHTFSYSLDPLSLQMENCIGTQICYDCLYDLEITIAGECGSIGLLGNTLPSEYARRNSDGSITYFYRNFSLDPLPGSYPANCHPAGFQKNFSLDFSTAGSYTITKKLIINEKAQDNLRDRFIANNINGTGCKTFEQVLAEQNSIMTAGDPNCKPTCESCEQTIAGGEEGYKARFQAELNLTNEQMEPYREQLHIAYLDAVENCKHACYGQSNESVRVENYRRLLLNDMMPDGGQYARLHNMNVEAQQAELNDDNDFVPGDATILPFNIFNAAEIGGAKYLHPKDEDGNDDVYRDNTLTADPTAASLSEWDPREFTSNFNESWANQLIYYHPEFKKLQIVEQADMQLSLKWGERLQEKETWADASAFIAGGLLPGTDPFYTLQGMTTTQDIKDAFYNKVVVEYAKIKKQEFPLQYITLNMWQFAVATIRCQHITNSGIIDCFDDPLIPSSFGGFPAGTCEADKNYIWTIFKTIYFSEREKFIQQYLERKAPTDPRLLTLNYYHLNFITLHNLNINQFLPPGMPDFNGAVGAATQVPPSVSNASAAGNEAMAEQYSKNCAAYADEWLRRMEVYNDCIAPGYLQITEAEFREIKDKLIRICISGSDPDHPMGSSSNKTGDLTYPTTFEQALTDFMTAKHVQLSAECHPYIIDWPKPYDKSMSPANEDIISAKPGDCTCERLGKLKGEYEAYKLQNNYAGSFQQYLSWYHGTVISNEDLTTLLSACSTESSADCHMFTTPITLGPALQCEASDKTCISCLEYQGYKSSYISKFSGVSGYAGPVKEATNENQEKWNNTFQLFMNQQTGFSKQWYEYLQFENDCVPYTSPSMTCNLLKAWKNEFVPPVSSLEDCQAAFTNQFNNSFSGNYTYDEIKTLYVNCGECNFTPCKQKKITKAEFEGVTKDFYATVGNEFFEAPDCEAVFANYFNNQFETGHPYDDIEKMYEYLSEGKILDICNKFNFLRLQLAESQFKQIYGPGVWTNGDCLQLFTTFFNIYFAASLSTGDIKDLYDKEKIKITVCEPPYTCEILKGVTEEFYNKYGSDIYNDAECNSLFILFFNEKLNSTYNDIQVRKLYLDVCKENLEVCKQKLSCDDLTIAYDDFKNAHPDIFSQSNCSQLFVSFMNTRFELSYTEPDWQMAYKLSCLTIPDFCTEGELITNCTQIQSILYTFRLLYPNPKAKFGEGCLEAFTIFVNQLTGQDYTSQAVIDMYLNLCGQPLDICEVSQCVLLQSYLNAYNLQYAPLKLTEKARITLFTNLFNRWYQAKDPVHFEDIKNMYQQCNIALSLSSEHSPDLNDCDMLQSLVTAYKAFNVATDPEACGNGFAAFFSLSMDVNKEYKELVEIYKNNCNVDLNICGSEEENTIDVTLERSACLVQQPRLCGLNTPISPVIELVPDDPCKDAERLALFAATEYWNYYVRERTGQFDKAYQEKCLSAKNYETFTVEAARSQYHYTLYYYDQAGNLVKTVPPAGVHERHDKAFLDNVKALRNNFNEANPWDPANSLTPDHQLETEYRYNTLGQVVEQKTPDAGISKFWYDHLGRLVVSQNAQQNKDEKFSYTIYDELGRISQVGQKPIPGSNTNTALQMTQSVSRSISGLKDWLDNAGTAKEQITRTVYDYSYYDADDLLCPQGLCQTNLRNRVSYTQLIDVEPAPVGGVVSYVQKHSAATFYTYDVSGNVYELLQDINQAYMKYKDPNLPAGEGVGQLDHEGNLSGNRFKKIQYEYDLISGKVNKVAYQPGERDQYYHRYEYDAENRITGVYTSPDNVFWDKDASYEYYKHGPLARMVLGQLRVQGVDYAYTLQGWLKGVNSAAVIQDGITNGGKFDMGQDGYLSGTHAGVARDVYSYSLNYFDGDYVPIAGAAANPFVHTGQHNLDNDGNTTTAAVAKPLYNGNIASMFVNIPKIGGANLYAYEYDQLNRIVGMDAFTGFNNATNGWATTPQHTQSYQERVSYDPNGNILTYLRNGDNLRPVMDQLTYTYKPNTNQLDKVVDAATDADASQYDKYNDIRKLKPDGSIAQQDGNYMYDAIGNLVQDKSEGIYDPAYPDKHMIEWTVYGKIKSITKLTGVIRYTYDAGGNRISKEYNGVFTYYVRDASGNVMALYEKNTGSGVLNNRLIQKEVHLYGSSRLGIHRVNRDMQLNLVDPLEGEGDEVVEIVRGHKFYELTNHLGNVLVTITDKKIQVGGVRPGQIEYYVADVASANDYYPFGMMMPGRKFAAGNGYRYGFNGKENDKDAGEGVQDYGLRIYDGRIGKFLSVDPLTPEYPWYTPYQFAGNMPIANIDLDGAEPMPAITGKEKEGDRQVTSITITDKLPDESAGGLNTSCFDCKEEIHTTTISKTWRYYSGNLNREATAGWYEEQEYNYITWDWENGKVMEAVSSPTAFDKFTHEQSSSSFIMNGHLFRNWEGYLVAESGYLLTDKNTGEYSKYSPPLMLNNGNILRGLGSLSKLRKIAPSLFKLGKYQVYNGLKNGMLYIGKTGLPLAQRYAGKIPPDKLKAFEELTNIPNNGIAKGVEQLVMNLNGWKGRGATTLLSNKNAATLNKVYIEVAERWLKKNVPNWTTDLLVK